MARVNCGSLAADFVLAGKSAAGKARRERHFMSKNELRSSGEASKMRFMTIECSRSVHSIVLRMARRNVREKVTVEPIINIYTNYVGVDKWEASN